MVYTILLHSVAVIEEKTATFGYAGASPVNIEAIGRGQLLTSLKQSGSDPRLRIIGFTVELLMQK